MRKFPGPNHAQRPEYLRAATGLSPTRPDDQKGLWLSNRVQGRRRSHPFLRGLFVWLPDVRAALALPVVPVLTLAARHSFIVRLASRSVRRDARNLGEHANRSDTWKLQIRNGD